MTITYSNDTNAVGDAALRLRLLTEHSNDVLCELCDGIVVYLSPNFAHVSGYSVDEFIGRSFREMIHPEDLPTVAPYMAPGWVGTIDVTVRLLTADRGWQWREARGVRIIDDAGRHQAVVVMRDIGERRRVEEALRVSEARTKALLTAIPDLMFRMTRDGTYLDFKAERAEDLYVPPEQIIGANMRDLMPPEITAAVLPLMERAIDEGSLETFEYRLEKRGTLRTYEARMMASGEDEVVLICRDVTAARESESALRASEERFRTLVDGTRDVVYTHDLQGNFTSVNPQAIKLYGYTADEIRGMNLAQIVDPAYLPLAIENMQRAFSGEVMLAPLEFLTYAKDGSAIWVEVVADPVLQDGQVVGFQGITRDVTAKKEVEELVRQQAQLLDLVSQAVIVMDLEGRITFWNRYATELFGWSPDDVFGTAAMDLGLPENRDRAKAAMAAVAKGERWSGEFFVADRQGRHFPALVLAAPMYDQQGVHCGGVCVAADITVLKEAEHEVSLAHEQKAVLEERTRIAQELHDSVAQFFFGIGMASKELLDRKKTSPSMLKRRLAYIRRLSTDGGREIRNAIHALSTAQADVPLDERIRGLLETFSGSDLRVMYEAGPGVGNLSRTVEGELYGAVREGLFNVRKHANALNVLVRIGTDDATARLSIEDDGTGRAEGILTSISQRSGFGLTHLHDRFVRLGGSQVVSNRLHGGVCVAWSLPLEAAA